MVRSLEVGQDPQHREQEAQVTSDRRLQQDLPVDLFLDLRVEGVDDLLAFGHYPEYLVAATEQGIGCPRQVFGDRGEQFDDLGLDGLQFAVNFLPVRGHGHIHQLEARGARAAAGTDACASSISIRPGPPR